MATRKTTKPASIPSRAFDHGAKAFGATLLRPKFSFTAEQDLAFALGHGGATIGPLTLLPDIDPVAVKKLKWLVARNYRNVAITTLRSKEQSSQKEVDAEVDPKPITDAEARTIGKRFFSLEPHDIRALEALVGPSLVLESLVERFEKGGDWDDNTLPRYFYVLCGLLLRVPPAEHAAAIARLEALYKKKAGMHGAHALDILLHGREGIRRSGYKYNPASDCYGTSDSDEPVSTSQLQLVAGEPEFLADSVRRLWELFSWKPRGRMNGPVTARVHFLSPAVLDVELHLVDTWPKTMQVEAFDAYEEIALPAAGRLMLRFTRAGSAVQKKAQRWFAEHPEHTRPWLEAWARGRDKPEAALAKALL
jgi:hypothetical protein